MNIGVSKYGQMILPDGKYYSLDDQTTRLNNNVLCIGSSGASKTRSVITPNLLECVGSYVITDAKGNLYRKWGKYMEDNGYRVIRLSFIHPEESAHYNPMKYVKTTHQIQQLASTFVYSDNRRSNDPFWDETSLMLLNSVIAYLVETYKEDSLYLNIQNIMELLRLSERKSGHESDLRTLMEKLELINEDSWAVKQFMNVSQSPDKTFACTVETALAKLGALDTVELEKMMEYDEIDLSSIGKSKTAVFVEVSDSDRSMDMLINLFFTQTMNQLCSYADEHCKDSQLPVPVRFLMDDFATNCKIVHFENMISNIRSRKISVILVIQSLSQLDAGYGDSAHTIIDNCDTMLYMGGNDPTTAREIAIRCDKTVQTILHMPLCHSWIFRRGSKPFMCRNMEFDDYYKDRIINKENSAEKNSEVI